jgi:hypothetical protein
MPFRSMRSCARPLGLLCLTFLVGLSCAATSLAADQGKPQQPHASASPVGPPSVEQTPQATGPAGTPEDQLDGVLKLFGELKHQEGFSEAERFVAVDDLPQARRQSVKRARLLIGKIDSIKNMLPKPISQFDGPLAQILLVAARTLEAGGENAEAVKIFERIVAEYPQARYEEGETKESISKIAAEAIRWHKEKHPWVQPELSGLVSKVREALKKHDKQALAALIARTGFWSGPFQSEGGPDDPDRVLRHLETVWPKTSLTVAEKPESFSDLERQVFLKTSGWSGEHPEIYFIMEKVPGGWHFSAIALASAPTKELQEPEAIPSGAGSPAPSPAVPATPAASPSPRPGASANR